MFFAISMFLALIRTCLKSVRVRPKTYLCREHQRYCSSINHNFHNSCEAKWQLVRRLSRLGGGGDMIELVMSLINKYTLNIAFGRLISNYDFTLLEQFTNVIIEYRVIITWKKLISIHRLW